MKKRIAIPICTQRLDHKSGKIGDFLFERSKNGFRAVSPVFPDYGSLLNWVEKNDGKIDLHNQKFPSGVATIEVSRLFL